MQARNAHKEYDCVGCKGKYRRCFYYEDEIKLGDEVVSTETINTAIEIRRENIYEGKPDLFILLEIGICPIPLFTSTSQALHKMYCLMGQEPLSYSDLNEMPAYCVEARTIIFNAEQEAMTLWVPVSKN